MFFERKDMIAVHTLACAALGILDNLARRGNIERMYGEVYKNPQSKKIRDMLNEARDFFKHADQDPDKVLKFKPDATKFFLLEAVRLAYHLTGNMVPECMALTVWFTLAHPDQFGVDGAPPAPSGGSRTHVEDLRPR
jgi:hypothetical protein